ncbi:hypothetical protein [Ornithinibacillus sp. 179-J 7C1 HS]|uniref:hypothetical protein n=1 Tax=Ornithinibacillus sp. 179-J 7C1 HS TaxID=3142384 RepID=UPI0039A1B6FF
MKKCYLFLLFIIVVTLVGCAENPALIGLNEEVQESPDGNESEPAVGESHSVSGPPDVHVGIDEESTLVVLDVWCWKEESLCNLEPNPPQEQLYGSPPLRVKPGEEFSFAIATTGIPESDHIYSPDEIELTQIRLSEENEVEVNNSNITAPMEKGRYYYSMKLKWDGDVVGQAYYVFGIIVQ